MEMVHLIGGLTTLVFGLVLSFMHADTLKKLAYDLSRKYVKDIYTQVAYSVLAGLGVGWLVYGLTTFASFSLLNVFLTVLSSGVFITLMIVTLSALIVRESPRLIPQVDIFFSTTILLAGLGSIIFGLLSFELLQPLFEYPLPKGIPFDNPLVTFYALFIMIGAFTAYWLSERAFIKKGFPRGYLEDIFLIAFPAGILGARLWYVWGQWEVEFANGPFLRIFYVWEGGLAIMGGALLGAIAGMTYVYFKKRDINLLDGVDVVLPTILVAQAIGRWGNFFNQEVYGAATETWTWLPSFIQSQMTIAGEFRVPLFLIESFINLSGYFVLVYLVGDGLKKWRYKGDIGLLYPVWYGLTRVILEPLRDAQYIMFNFWSFFWGIAFVVLGLLGIVINHYIQDQLLKKKKI
jgi:prolipoprotein diacylglyceryl transferase